MWSCIIIFSAGAMRPVRDNWHPKCSPQVSSSKRASLFLLIELSLKSLKNAYYLKMLIIRDKIIMLIIQRLAFLGFLTSISTHHFFSAQRNYRRTEDP